MLRNMGWRWFPVGLFVAMGLVFMINGYMVYAAVRSFPGDAGADGFDLSNSYGRVLATASHQTALGWTLDAGLDAANHPSLRLTGPAGAMLPSVVIEAKAERPVGPDAATVLVFQPTDPTRYTADHTLAQGQWDLLLTIKAAGDTMTTTRRLTVP